MRLHAHVRAWAERVMSRRNPDFVIGEAGNLYVLRWWIWRNPVCSLYLHKFLRSDTDEALHDHPYENVSWVLAQGYLEVTPTRAWLRSPGTIVFRLAHWPHRVELFTRARPIGQDWLVTDVPALSLFLCGPRRRNWGFHCPQGWRAWQDFVRLEPGGNSRGKGCEE